MKRLCHAMHEKPHCQLLMSGAERRSTTAKQCVTTTGMVRKATILLTRQPWTKTSIDDQLLTAAQQCAGLQSVLPASSQD